MNNLIFQATLKAFPLMLLRGTALHRDMHRYGKQYVCANNFSVYFRRVLQREQCVDQNVLQHDFGNTRPNPCGSTGFEEGFITHAATERLQTHIPHVIKSSSFSHADWIRMADIAASL